MSQNNQYQAEPINAVGSTEDPSKWSDVKQNYYNMVDQVSFYKSEINSPATKSGMASNYAIMAYMVSVNSMYGAEMQTNQVRLLQDEQDLSTAMSKLLTDLQNIEKTGLSYTPTKSGDNYATPTWKDGKINGQANVISSTDAKQLAQDYKNVQDVLNGMKNDCETYFTSDSIKDSFNDMYNQAQTEINAVWGDYGSGVWVALPQGSGQAVYNLGQLISTYANNPTDQNLDNLTNGLNFAGYVHTCWQNKPSSPFGSASSYIQNQDNFDKWINGGLVYQGNTAIGVYNEVHVELDQDMTETQNDISQMTAMLQQNNDANVDMTKSMEQLQLAISQGVVK